MRTASLVMALAAPLSLAVAGSVSAAGQLVVRGTLAGYFVTPEGVLTWRELTLSSSGDPSAPLALHPLWIPYGGRLTITAPAPIRHLRVMSAADGSTLYERAFDPPCAEVTAPHTGPTDSVRLPPPGGPRARVEVTLDTGARLSATLQPDGVRLLDASPLRVDWLMLTAVAEGRRFLQEHGDAILPGLRADGVLTALQGDGGQLVGVGPPETKPEPGCFGGPAPPGLVLAVLETGAGRPDTNAAGWASPGGGYVVFPFTDTWWTEQPAIPNGKSSSVDPWRLNALVHELAHVQWAGKRGAGDPKASLAALLGPSPEARAREALERRVLWRALDGEDDDLPGAVRQYLALREHRAAMSKDDAELVEAEGELATTEGLAYYAGERAEDLLDGGKMPTDRLLAGLAAGRLRQEEAEGSATTAGYHYITDVPSVHGIAQVVLLERLRLGAVRTAWGDGVTLVSRLAQLTGFEALSPRQRQAATTTAEEADGLAELRRVRREQSNLVRDQLLALGRAQGADKAIPLRISLALPSAPSPGRRWTTATQYVSAVLLPFPGAAVMVRRPCAVKLHQYGDEQRVEVTTYLRESDDWVTIEDEGPGVFLQSKNKEVTVKTSAGRLSWSKRGLALRARYADDEGPAVRRASKKGDGVMNRQRFMVAIPLLLAAAQASWAQLPHHTITATQTGLYRDANTGQTQQLSLNVWDRSQIPPGDWQMIPNETYTVTLTVTDPQYSRLAEVSVQGPEGQLQRTLLTPPAAAGTASVVYTAGWFGDFIDIFEDPEIVWEIVYEDPPGHTIVRGTLRKKTPPVPGAPDPKKVTLSGQVIMFIPNGTAQPAAGANVRIWLDGQTPEQGTSQPAAIDGTYKFLNISPGTWWVQASSGGFPACIVQRGPFTWRQGTLATQNIVLFQHCGIVGRVAFQPTGQGQSGMVTVALLKDGQVVQGPLSLDPVANPDNTYNYNFMPAPPGAYVVRATCQGQVPKTEAVTVSNGCTAVPNPDGGRFPQGPGGTHSPVNVPTFTFTIQGQGGGPPGGGGGGNPPGP